MGKVYSMTIKYLDSKRISSDQYKVHTFTSDSNLVVTGSGNVEYIIVGGGGGGGGSDDTPAGSGGGAGGYRTSTSNAVTAQTYAITVGTGGSGGTGNASGSAGNDSVFNSITSSGGGGGSAFGTPSTNGGSGGGKGWYQSSNGSGNTPSTIPSQGNDGGLWASSNANYQAGAGGGGAGGAGLGITTNTQTGANGGTGTASSISGSSVTYAGGGGGGSGGGTNVVATGGTGGSGGGGAGGNTSTTGTNGTNGTTNLGSGGGGGGGFYAYVAGQSTGGNGGKGIVIIRYLTSSDITATGGTITTVTDAKPTNVQDNFILVEKDTGKRFWSSANLKIDTDFSTNTGWDQEGTEIAINTGTGKLDWIGLRSSTNTGISYDFGAGIISTSKWRLEFDLYIQNFSGTSYTQRFGWMLSTKGSADNSDQLRDFIGGRVSYRGQAPTDYQEFNTIDDQGSTDTWADNVPYQPAHGTDAGVTPVAGTTYNIVLTRDSATAYTMTISSGGTLLDTLNYTSYAGTSDLRYLLIQRYGDGASAGSSFNGTIDNLKFYNGVTSAIPVTWTNGTPFYPYIDDFSTDKGWVTTNSTKYNYNSSGYIYFDAASTQQDARISFDLGADNILSNTAWVMRWKQNITTYAQGSEAQHLSFTIALSKDNVNASTATAFIALGHASNSGVTYYKEGHNTSGTLSGVTGGTSLSEVPAANVRYVEMIRKNATQFSIRITANSDYSGGSFIDNQDCTGIADLRYVVLVNNNTQAAGSARWTGQFSDLSIYNGVTSV